jgi:mono/diheme cytochrome c family protein
MPAPRISPTQLAALLGGLAFFGLGVARSPVTQEAAPVASPDQVVFFETKIRPVLAENCYKCHSGDMEMAGLRLDSRAAIVKGGDTGSAIVAGDPGKSLLIQAIKHVGEVKMPPKSKLAAAEIADIEAWVRMGAPWPAEKAPLAEMEPLWSLQPVVRPQVPSVRDAKWARSPIDSFVLARMEAEGVKPAPAADKRSLIRRVSYDLTGLPPTPEEVDAFLADNSPTAYEKVVDRLLASPRYGERWARHWMDVARYADTKGYVFEEDRNYYHAYTYREWLIDAFNKDLPYDQFIVQQLAADRLPEIKDGDDRKALAAMGFLTIGRRFLNQQPDIIDDRIDVTMRGFQGFTVACARCHDHKFDPVPTQDYYSLYAVFASSDEATLPISEQAIREPWERHNVQVAEMEKAERELILAETRRLREVGKESGKLPKEVEDVLRLMREGVVASGDNLNKLLTEFKPEERERLRKVQADLVDIRKNAPPTPEFAMAMVDSAKPRDGVVFRRGNPGNHGEAAPRRFLLALSASEDRVHWTSGSGRLELAQAIASEENPLTARVFVNRSWSHLFGAGLVRTPSDFGYQGDPPTHPELLDWMAAEFMANDWSIKRLHKQMVMSSTYRQSSTASAAVLEKDPDNRLLNRMNRKRLDLEQLRDSVLVASARLDASTTGGKSVDLWAQPFSQRRAVYGFIERQNLPGVFRTFDFASPDATSPRRFLTTVPQQALFMMNSPFSAEHARAMSERSELVGAKDDAERVRRLYRLLLGRLPDAEELAVGVQYLRRPSQGQGPSLWQYGYGDETRFVSMPTFAGGVYRGGAQFPDPKLHYLMLNAQGGHPGIDAAHSAIRRWTSPADTLVSISGLLAHREAQGDGVRLRIISSRSGSLGEWTVHNSEAAVDVRSLLVRKGDRIDFVVDPREGHAFDSFFWAPTIVDLNAKTVWRAEKEFAPPRPATLNQLALYAQALMMTNEFMFVD